MGTGYSLSREIYRGQSRIVFAARRDSDGREVIIKTPRERPPGPAARAAIRREFEVHRRLELDGVGRAIELREEPDGSVSLVLEDAGGQQLKTLLAGGRLDPRVAVAIGARLARILDGIHRAGFVHRDLNPANVHVTLHPLAVSIVDLSLTETLEAIERTGNSHVLEGTPAYVAPEQTGRVGWGIDQRTDLYALGVTLYQMLAGRLPFESDDPLEVVHAHIARSPDPLSRVAPGVPTALSDVVARLLEKLPGDRYQTASGAAADLDRCLSELDRTGGIAPFELGTQDRPRRLRAPGRLYGRERELAHLYAAFARASVGRAELVLLAGYAGIGKTAIVREFQRSIPDGGRALSGKFDQIVTVPYAAVREAFSALARGMLAASDEDLSRHRGRLLEALGRSGGVILDVIPEFEPILGEQPEVPGLGPAEAENRLNLLFQRFAVALAAEVGPLVLFLDDLQWADAASLHLLGTLLSAPDLTGLLVIGAYRDNEVGDGHPLPRTVADIEGSGGMVSRISLGPVTDFDLARLVADVLDEDADRALPLTELVQEKTGGNPFFVSQFLKALIEEGTLIEDRAEGRWRYDLDLIRTRRMTANVVDLLAGRLERLSGPSRRLLQVASFVGNRFDTGTLARLLPGGGAGLDETLLAIREEGFVQPADEGDDKETAGGRGWAFLHDRIQQAAYASVPDSERPALHREIGRSLLAAHDGGDPGDAVFAIVDHLNHALGLLDDEAERARVAELNEAAGRRARASAAYDSAARYFEAAARLLPSDAWTRRYEMALRCHLELAECEYLSGDHEAAARTFEVLDAEVRDEAGLAATCVLRARQFETQALYGEAIEAVRPGLSRLGIDLPGENDRASTIAAELDAVQALVRGRSIASFASLPPLADPGTRLALQLLAVAWAPAYIRADADLIAWIAARMVRLSVERGNSEESAFGYVTHGITLGTRLLDYAAGHEFGRVALALNERLGDTSSRAKIHELFGCFVNQWRRPFEECRDHARISYETGLEIGDFAYATYGGIVESWYALLTSRDLEAYASEYLGRSDVFHQIKNHSFADAQRTIVGWALALAGRTTALDSLNDGEYSEAEYAERYEDVPFFLAFLHVTKLHLHLVAGQHEAAAAAAGQAEATIGSLAATVWPALLCQYRALALAARTPAGSGACPDRDRIAADRDRLELWASNCPENFSVAHELVTAELARIDGRHLEAETHYAEAISLAEQRGYPLDLALANERYARAWHERDQPEIAGLFLTAALGAYEVWGATAKARELRYELERPIVTGRPSAPGAGAGPFPTPVTPLVTTRTTSERLDSEWILRAAAAIAGEIELSRLLEKLTRILLASAGAELAVLVLDVDGHPLAQAIGRAGGGIEVLRSVPIDGPDAPLPASVFRYVHRTGEALLAEDLARDPAFVEDEYVRRVSPRGALCVPAIFQGRRLGAFYFENNVSPAAFTRDHVRVLEGLAALAAAAIHNSALFEEVGRLKDRLEAENVYLQEEIQSRDGFEEIIGRSPRLTHVLRQVEQVAPTDATVLIFGETGTGKELLARAIHRLSPRSARPLVAVNCGAISAGLVESELFGHERGAFTGAVARKIGRFELADGGTIFLDEIGDLSHDLQVKLLRVLQEGEIQRVGGNDTLRVDVRVIAATHRDLEEAVEEGSFRADLFYRLNVFPVRSPPLRERLEDVPLLARYFLDKDGARLGKRIERIPKPSLDALLAYPWPGNIRELRNVVERSIITTTGDTLDLDVRMLHGTTGGAPGTNDPRTLEEVQRSHILDILEQTGWVVSGPRGAARRLGLKPTTLESRMKKLGIRRPGAAGEPL